MGVGVYAGLGGRRASWREAAGDVRGRPRTTVVAIISPVAQTAGILAVTACGLAGAWRGAAGSVWCGRITGMSWSGQQRERHGSVVHHASPVEMSPDRWRSHG